MQVTMTVRLSARPHLLLRAAAAKAGMSMQAFITEAIEEKARKVLSSAELEELEQAARQAQAVEAQAVQMLRFRGLPPQE